MKVVLHAGCGFNPLPRSIFTGDWREVRLDANPDCEPDICADIRDLGEIGPFDAIYCSHTLEHLHRDDVGKALREFRRVLASDGAVLIIVPNLDGVRPTDEVLYDSPAGPVCGLDLFYGMAKLTRDHPLMMHQTGFIEETLRAALEAAGFVAHTRTASWQLVGVGTRA